MMSEETGEVKDEVAVGEVLPGAERMALVELAAVYGEMPSALAYILRCKVGDAAALMAGDPVRLTSAQAARAAALIAKWRERPGHLGWRVACVRCHAGWSSLELARRAGIYHKRVNAIEAQAVESVQTVRDVREAFAAHPVAQAVTLDDLLCSSVADIRAKLQARAAQLARRRKPDTAPAGS